MLARLRIGLVGICLRRGSRHSSIAAVVFALDPSENVKTIHPRVPHYRSSGPAIRCRSLIYGDTLAVAVQIAQEAAFPPMFLWPVVLCPRCNGPPSGLGKRVAYHSPSPDRQAPREVFVRTRLGA